MTDQLTHAAIDIFCLLIAVWIAPPMARQLGETYRLQERSFTKIWLIFSMLGAAAVVWFDYQRLDAPDDLTLALFFVRHFVQAYILYAATMCLMGRANITALEVLVLQATAASLILIRYMLSAAWDFTFDIDARAFALNLIVQGVLPFIILRSTPRAIKPPMSDRIGAYGFGRSSGARKAANLRGSRKKFSGPVKKAPTDQSSSGGTGSDDGSSSGGTS